MVIVTNIHVSRIAGKLEKNVRKFSGKRGMTAQGSCGDAQFVGLRHVTSVLL